MENRRLVLEAALVVFSDFGFSGASTRAIAALAGIEQGHLAYYFPTKLALWQQVIEAFAREGERCLSSQLEDARFHDPVRVAEKVLPDYLRSFARNPRLTRLMLQEFSVNSPRHEWVLHNLGKPVWDLLRPLFETLASDGRLGGASPSSAYFNMLGSALIAFSNPDLVRSLTGADATDPDWMDDTIRNIMGWILARAEDRPSGEARAWPTA